MKEVHGPAPEERYVVEATLGSGTSGTVYRAFDRVRRATVAIKVLERLDPDSLLRFKGEFRQLARIVHPNLLQLHELVVRGDKWILSMELVEGVDFLRHVRPRDDDEPALPFDELDALDTEYLGSIPPPANDVVARRSLAPPKRTGGKLDPSRLRLALHQLCEGLHALHAARRVHRDLKPANVLVSRADERVVICDFGLVIEGASGRASMPADPRTQTYADSKIAGTPAYMSPEQMAGRPVTAASDWYSVGLMLYQALTGQLPFDPNLSWAALYEARMKETPPHPLALAPDAPTDLAQLALALIQPNPAHRPGHRRILSILDGESRPSVPDDRATLLIGRENELALLHEALDRAGSGTCTLVTVSGPSGMGKSSLIQAFLDEVRTHDDAIVLSGRCYERENVPHKAIDPLMDALSSYLRELDRSLLDDIPGLSELARMFPVLRRIRAVAEAPELPSVRDMADEKRAAVMALRELCRRLARMAPLILCIDDLQWGDLDSAPLLIDLLRAPRAPALLMIWTYRAEDEERSPLLHHLQQTNLGLSGVSDPVRLTVSALAPEAARAFARVLLGDMSDAEGTVERIVQEAGGNPFFLRELASYVRTHDLGPAHELRLEDMISMRIADLSKDSLTLLSVIAAAGRPERRQVIERAAGLGPRARQAYRALEAQRLVQFVGSDGDGRVEPCHDRIREAVYRSLEENERRRLHGTLAAALETMPGEGADPNVLLEHHRNAGDRDRAATYALRAAEQAESLLAFERAASLLREAMALSELAPEEHRVLEERLAYALMQAGRGIEAADVFFRAIEGAPEEKAAELRSLATAQLLRSGLVPRAFEELQRAEGILALRPPRHPVEAIFMLLWRRCAIRLRGLKLRNVGRPLTTSERVQMDLLWSIASALSPIDQLRAAVYQAEHMLLAQRSGDRYRFARALAIESTTYATKNRRPERTRAVLDRAMEMAGASREPHALSAIFGVSGVCRLLEGRFLESIRLAQKTLSIQMSRLGGTLAWDRVVIEHFELRARALSGDIQNLVERVPDLVRDAEARGDLYAAVSMRTSHCCWAWLAPDRPDLAREQVAIAERQWSQDGYHLQHWYTTQAVCSIALYTGDVEEARARLAREWRKLALLRKKIQFTRAEILYLRGRLALSAARTSGDASLIAAARADARSLMHEGPPWILAMGRLLDACALSFTEKARTAELLFEVEGQFEAVEMNLHAAVCALRRAELLGEGVSAARAVIRAMGVARPEGFAELLAPMRTSA